MTLTINCHRCGELIYKGEDNPFAAGEAVKKHMKEKHNEEENESNCIRNKRTVH